MKFKITILLLIVSAAVSAQIQLQNLRCELLTNPLGIDVKQPRLTWAISSSKRNTLQTAYEIIVASSADKLNKNIGDFWDSKKINSDESIQNKYAGKILNSRQQCFWKVKVWTNNGESNWSEPKFWTMGLLQPTDWK